MNILTGRNRVLNGGAIVSLLLMSVPVLKSTSEAAVVNISFSDSVMVNDTLIRVGDIAEVGCADQGLRKSIQNFSVGNSAPAGYSRLINTDDLVLYRLKSGFKGVEFEVSGNSRISVATDFKEMKVGDFANEIKQYLDSTIKWPEGSWSVEIENQDVSWKTLNKPLSISVKGLADRFPRGKTQIVLIAEQGSQKNRLNVVCDIRVTVPVLVASGEILRGQIINRENCEIKNLDITRFAPVPFTSFEQLQEMRAARTISSGTIIHSRLLQVIPAVEKGDQVQILFEKGRVKLSVTGVAREPGKVGERIWVENAATNKLIRVVVRGKGKVCIPQGGELI